MHLLHLPKIGYTMESGAITGWLVDEGASFEVGEPLYEVETEKNIVQVEAKLPGTLVRAVAAEDSVLNVGGLIAVVADPGELLSPDDVSAAIAAEQGAASSSPAAVGDSVRMEGPAALVGGPDPGEGTAAVPGRSSGGRVRALPKVRAAAERLGVDLASVTGTGPRGALTVTDVEQAAGGSAADAPGSPAVAERRALGAVQRAMVAGVSRSWSQVPQFVQQFRVDMTAVNEFRAAKNAAGTKIGLTAVLAAAIAHAAAVIPEVNSTLDGNDNILYADVNVAIAVRSDRGLVVPVLAEVQRLSVGELDSKVRTLVENARSGSLPSDAAPTITLSNLGGYGVETGMPLVTAPQAAIVFTGDIVDTPVAVDGRVEVRPLLGVAMGYDHRIVDGATGGEFAKALREVLGDPGRLDTAASAS